MNITSIGKHLEAVNQLLESPIVNQQEVQRHLKHVNAFPLLLFTIPATTRVYRASTSFTNEYFDNIPRISYPPKSCVKNYGRANIPGQSLFYCSEDEQTSYLELMNFWVKNVEVGQFFYVTMGEWETKESIESIVVVSPNGTKRESKFETSSGNAYDEYRKGFTRLEQEISDLVYEKLSDWYSRPARVGNDIYKVTANMSNKLFAGGKFHGHFKNASISYPSVANYEEGVNFAFEPKIVASGKLQLRRTWRLKLMSNRNENGFFHFTEVGREYGTIENDGSLKWESN